MYTCDHKGDVSEGLAGGGGGHSEALVEECGNMKSVPAYPIACVRLA